MVQAAQAQIGRWDQQGITAGGTSKFGTRVHVDQWGHTHVLWAAQAIWGSRYDWESRDPSRAGVQLFYSSNVTGVFTPPIQVTDTLTGSVFVRKQNSAPWAFRVDRRGSLHAAYVANAFGRPSLYYMSNADFSMIGQHRFTRYYPLVDLPGGVDTVAFDIAVDSVGTAHVVWIDWSNGMPELHHWRSDSNTVELLWQFQCTGGGCRVGFPEAEVSPDGRLTVAVRTVNAGTGAIFMMRQVKPNRFGPGRWLQPNPIGRELGGPSLFDLRLRMAVDSSNGVHLILPYTEFVSNKFAYRLLYIYSDSSLIPDGANDPGIFYGDARRLEDAALDTVVRDLDITYNGAGRVDATWLTRRKAGAAKIAYVGMMREAPMQGWKVMSKFNDVRAKLGPAAFPWKDDLRISSVGNRVVLAGLYDVPLKGDTTKIPQVGIIEGYSLLPRLQYLHPDAAAPGMNVVVEAYAPVNRRGAFGADSLGTGQLELVDPADAERVMIGPSVISWDGRLASTMIFVKPGAAIGPVPLRIRSGIFTSNVDTFFIMQPQRPGGTVGELSGGGTIGQGRSRRGVLVVDSLVLLSGTYTIDTTDCDPYTPGNQGFLPLTILSQGPVRIEEGARLSVSAVSDDAQRISYAGPGGGGGGSGGEIGGGSGYTGGGGPVLLSGQWLMGISIGSGNQSSGFWSGGASLNGAPGGASYVDAPGGGGVGHPFGAAGAFGQPYPTEPVERNPGAYGGGSGGAKRFGPKGTVGGGGGGNATAGHGGDLALGTPDANGGKAVGSRQIVPMAGGSGGGGGGFGSGGLNSGGSGGGALALYSFSSMVINGRIEANGGRGLSNPTVDLASGGGGGSGGSIMLGAQKAVRFGRNAGVYATGGDGGRKGLDGFSMAGGRGGDGRLRIDGKITGLPDGVLVPGTYFAGPGNAESSRFQARADSTISGYASPDSTVLVWKRTETGPWTSVLAKADAEGIWKVKLSIGDVEGGRLYVVVMQRVTNPSRTDFTYEPSWVMSTAGANIIGSPDITLSADSLKFDCIHYRGTTSRFVEIGNPGDISDLVLTDVQIKGEHRDKFMLDPGMDNYIVEPGSTLPIRVVFTPGDTGTYEADLVMHTNIPWKQELTVRLVGCGVSGAWQPNEMIVDLGELCVNDCRDTSIVLHNSGTADMMVEKISPAPGSANALEITAVNPPAPFQIPTGQSLRVQLRLCVKRFTDNGADLLFKSDAVDSVMRVIVRATNAMPMPELPREVDFGRATPSTADSCIERLITVYNRNPKTPMRLGRLSLASDVFRIVAAPLMNTEVPPGDSMSVIVRFCPDAEGRYGAVLVLSLEGGACALDTTISLVGAAGQLRPQYVLVEPDTSDRTVQFPSVLADGPNSVSRNVTIRNVGGAPGGIVTARLLAPSDHFSVSGTITDIPVTEERSVTVAFDPATVGSHEARLVLSSVDPVWHDTVTLRGRGTDPGLQTDALLLNFGVACIDAAPPVRVLRIFNNADHPITIRDISTPPQPYGLNTKPPKFPILLMPNETLEVEVYLAPVIEGVALGQITIDAGGEPIMVRLNGSVQSGHIAAPTELDFGCHPTGADTVMDVTLKNTGVCPVTVQKLEVRPPGSGFTLIAQPDDDEIPAGGERTYMVRYRAGTTPANASLYITSTAPNLLPPVALAGGVCNVEEPRIIRLSIPAMSAPLGDGVTIPIEVRVSPPSAQDISYTLELGYAYDLLIPRIGAREDAPPASAWTAGTVSSTAALQEPVGGVLTITGVIRKGEVTGTLVNVPMKVLLGTVCNTVITFNNASATGATVMVTGSRFQATNCGDVVVGGTYGLKQNTPNPVDSRTRIEYSIARRDHVQLNLYDAMGRLVMRLVDGVQDAGEHSVEFNTKGVPSGVYSYELVSGSYRSAMRMILQK